MKKKPTDTTGLIDVSQIVLNSNIGGFENIKEFTPCSLSDSDNDKTGRKEEEESDAEEIFTIMAKDKTGPCDKYDKIIPTDSNFTKREIIGVDSSSVTLGRTNTGIIAAIKASAIFYDHLETFGPYIYHITEYNKNEIYNYYIRDVFGLSSTSVVAPQLSKMPDRLRNFLERLVQKYCSSRLDKGIILWDGSLGAGKSQFDTPEALISSLIYSAKDHGNSIVAVTKQTTLVLSSNESIFSVLDGLDGPILIDLSDNIALLGSRMYKVLGNTFAAKLSYNGLPFRIDVSAAATADDSALSPSSVLVDLIGNTSFFHGYPIQLRDAHIYAKITKDEVLACQRMIANQYDIQIIDTPDIHKLLLSPFG